MSRTKETTTTMPFASAHSRRAPEAAPLPIVAPIHLGVPSGPGSVGGAEAIASVFGVSRRRVALWAREGAPIVLVGRRLQAEYNTLMAWLVQRRRL